MTQLKTWLGQLYIEQEPIQGALGPLDPNKNKAPTPKLRPQNASLNNLS